MAVKIYDANTVSIIVGGIPIDSGFADGEFLRIEQEEQFAMFTGSDGEVTRSKTNMKGVRITILLAQTSLGNTLLSLLHQSDLLNDNGAGVVPMMVRDRGGLSIFTSDSVWISKFPDESYDRETTAREWVLDGTVSSVGRFVGGN